MRDIKNIMKENKRVDTTYFANKYGLVLVETKNPTKEKGHILEIEVDERGRNIK